MLYQCCHCVIIDREHKRLEARGTGLTFGDVFDAIDTMRAPCCGGDRYWTVKARYVKEK